MKEKYKGPFKKEDLTECGYYWWLPKYLLNEPDKEENWSVLLFSPNDPRFHYSGVFYGPIYLPEHEGVG